MYIIVHAVAWLNETQYLWIYNQIHTQYFVLFLCISTEVIQIFRLKNMRYDGEYKNEIRRFFNIERGVDL